MSTRTISLATGREFSFAIEKSGSPVILGCASNVDYQAQKEVLTANCQSGKKKIVSGDDPDYTITVTGFYQIYATGDVASNVSATEIETYLQNGTEVEWLYKGPHTGDPSRSGTGFISSFSMGTPVEGLATYNFVLTPFEMPTIGTSA